jgi:hypothetical protein
MMQREETNFVKQVVEIVRWGVEVLYSYDGERMAGDHLAHSCRSESLSGERSSKEGVLAILQLCARAQCNR